MVIARWQFCFWFSLLKHVANHITSLGVGVLELQWNQTVWVRTTNLISKYEHIHLLSDWQQGKYVYIWNIVEFLKLEFAPITSKSSKFHEKMSFGKRLVKFLVWLLLSTPIITSSYGRRRSVGWWIRTWFQPIIAQQSWFLMNTRPPICHHWAWKCVQLES